MQGEERRGKTAHVVTTLNNTKHTERPQEVAWARPKGKHTAEESVWFASIHATIHGFRMV